MGRAEYYWPFALLGHYFKLGDSKFIHYNPFVNLMEHTLNDLGERRKNHWVISGSHSSEHSLSLLLNFFCNLIFSLLRVEGSSVILLALNNNEIVDGVLDSFGFKQHIEDLCVISDFLHLSLLIELPY